MYYLCSITPNCVVKVLPDKLLNYPHWSCLSRADADEVFGQAYMRSPDELWERSSTTMRAMTSASRRTMGGS